MATTAGNLNIKRTGLLPPRALLGGPFCKFPPAVSVQCLVAVYGSVDSSYLLERVCTCHVLLDAVTSPLSSGSESSYISPCCQA